MDTTKRWLSVDVDESTAIVAYSGRMGSLAFLYLLCLAVPDGGVIPAASPLVGSGQVVDDYRSLIDEWLSTQNTGRFADYVKLYAPDFRGTRRSDDRMVQFDREGWLADRERMFRKKMRVKVDSVRVLMHLEERLDVGFEQEFAQGPYHDRGSKILRLHRVDGRLLIEREEMLTSEVLHKGLPALNLPLTVDTCSGEHCSCVGSNRLKAAVELRERPDRESAIILRLPARTRVQSVAFKMVIHRPGIARRKDGSRVYYFGYATEGACLIHTGKKLDQASCDQDLEIEDDRVAGEDWVAITYKGQTGYTKDDSATPHGTMVTPGKCAFGGY